MKMNDSSCCEKKGFGAWFEARLPLGGLVRHAVGDLHPTPRNLNYWWNFGSIAGICLMAQILTGLFLAMHYAPLANAILRRIAANVDGTEVENGDGFTLYQSGLNRELGSWEITGD